MPLVGLFWVGLTPVSWVQPAPPGRVRARDLGSCARHGPRPEAGQAPEELATFETFWARVWMSWSCNTVLKGVGVLNVSKVASTLPE